MVSYPIAILSFDRPGYLARVLTSLQRQKSICIDEEDIHLFQDGGLSNISNISYADKANINTCIAMFRAFFPKGVVHQSESNIGIAMNYKRAEEFIFVEREREIGFFLEDDLELGEHYMRVMYRLANFALKRDDIGYFSAYGHHRALLAEQQMHQNEIICMAHNWAFGLTRKHWKKSRKYVAQYLALLQDSDYSQRPTEKIKELFAEWGCGAPGSSQDVAKTLACFLVGSKKINTYQVFGKYIGEKGVHSTPDQYSAEGFGSAVITDSTDFDCSSADDKTLAACYDVLRSYCNTVSI